MGLRISIKSAIIKYLNNLDHCISYDTVLQNDTSWSIGIMNEGQEYSTKPSNIQPKIFMQAAFDNGSYVQEKASQPVTNTVLYQITQGSSECE